MTSHLTPSLRGVLDDARRDQSEQARGAELDDDLALLLPLVLALSRLTARVDIGITGQ